MPDMTSASTTNASGSQPTKKNTQGPCRQLKAAKVTRVTNERIMIEYDDQHRAAPTTEQHSALDHDIGHVVRSNGSLGRRYRTRRTTISTTSTTICWRTSTGSSLNNTSSGRATYTNILRRLLIHMLLWRKVARRSLRIGKKIGCGSAMKVKANKINLEKKTLLHHSGSRPFSYRMKAQWQAMMMEKRQLVLQELASQLSPETLIEYVDPLEDARFQILTNTLD
ncbi:hypothetical protein C1H46_004198 [Malus baccata]|uniref:Uncharacterized protein n=1 Tax=Malus baccata TaxID=106549 RepID=A0A540NGT0_MALBA|nr:hypothetical protein C1H46_004198 [Malus baccata]